jgi:hypothetical protein
METHIQYATPPDCSTNIPEPIPPEKNPVAYVPDKNLQWWEWLRFPSNAAENGLSVTPETIKNLIDAYAVDSLTIQDHCELAGLGHSTINYICRKFPEVAAYYRQAQMDKAHNYNRDAVKLYQDPIPEQFLAVDKQGNKVPVMAGVRYMENKKDLLLRQAEIHELGTYQQRVAVDNRNINLNMNLNANVDINDLEKMPLDALLKPND